MHPIAFRVHTHELGNVVSGYLVNDEIFELGRMNPQKPEVCSKNGINAHA